MSDSIEPKPETPFHSSSIAHSLEQTQVSKFHVPGGTGFAAEDANALSDRLRFKSVELTGRSNELNGPDRVVNGIAIQTKYYGSATATLEAAFDSKSGLFRYSDQLLEVPKDQYQDCIAAMRRKITEGKVPNILDPDAAEKIVKQGRVTYRQARNIAKAGNIDSLSYDIKSQAVTTGSILAISFLIDYGFSKWAGDSHEISIKNALPTALKAGSQASVIGVLSAQVLRTRSAALGTVAVRHGIKLVHGTVAGKSAIQQLASASLGKTVTSGPAINHVSKLLRSNIITSVIAVTIASIPDFYRASVSKSISWKQFFKNLIITIAGVFAAIPGWMLGMVIGAAIGSPIPVLGPFVGGAIGGLFGGLVTGFGASWITRKILNQWIIDDSVRMTHHIQVAINQLSEDFLLTEVEQTYLLIHLESILKPAWLRKMHRSGKGRGQECTAFAYSELEKECEKIIGSREKLSLPAPDEVLALLETESVLLAVEDAISNPSPSHAH